jgi:hydrogenase expression/formation protein HypD
MERTRKQAQTSRLAASLREAMKQLDRPVRLMEVCGTHTVAIFRCGLRTLFPSALKLISGPGCPVCVTAQGYIDAACRIARRPDVSVLTYGDMVRVPGGEGSLETCRGEGAHVAVVYSPRDAVQFAADHPDREVVFLAVGFETTAPGTAAAVLEARRRGVENLSFLMGHKRVLPALEMLVAAEDLAIDGFVLPGHVSVILGTQAYRPLAERRGVACAVAGFEPQGILAAILELLEQLRTGDRRVANCYSAAVPEDGNPVARGWMEEVFRVEPASWRAIGEIPDSGLALREPYRDFDALERLGERIGPDVQPAGCRCGEVIQGRCEPVDCELFGRGCTPRRPVGPCMVSSEGTCAAWFRYRR